MSKNTLVTTVRQKNGNTREVHAQDAGHAARARQILRRDPAMIHYLDRVYGIEITVRVVSSFEAQS